MSDDLMFEEVFDEPFTIPNLTSMGDTIPAADNVPFWAYTAGLLDGEGYIGISRALISPQPTYAPSGKFFNTHLGVVQYLERQLGGRVNITKGTFKTKQVYILSWSGERLHWVLTRALPYLIIKEQQARLVLEFIKTVDGTKGPLSAEVHIQRGMLYEQCRLLTHRGP